jgi:nanoRNase/pAp phosphatase (c-di-AMP/oligoRNAs hydrolase)
MSIDVFTKDSRRRSNVDVMSKAQGDGGGGERGPDLPQKRR